LSNEIALQKRLYVLLGSLIVGFSVTVLGSWYWWQSAIAPAASSTNSTRKAITIKISQGLSAQAIGKQLKQAGLIRSQFAWRIWLFVEKLENKPPQLKAGHYKFSKELSLPEIGNQIRQGETIETNLSVEVTIPEGWTQQEIAEYFEQLGYFTAEEFLKTTRNMNSKHYPWLPDDLPHLEGFLYPGTYHLPDDRVSPKFIINRKLQRFEQVALPLYKDADTPYSIKEWVTLASLVEEEVLVEREYPKVAAVFAKRLNKDMPLESDPTVEYAFNLEQTKYRPLTIEQVNQDSPYNTYINKGLPPTPIANPAKQALRASLNPPKTDNLFFLARYDGTHVFSQTYQQHKAAQRRFQ